MESPQPDERGSEQTQKIAVYGIAGLAGVTGCGLLALTACGIVFVLASIAGLVRLFWLLWTNPYGVTF